LEIDMADEKFGDLTLIALVIALEKALVKSREIRDKSTSQHHDRRTWPVQEVRAVG
jgi:hypothetical protein